MFSKYSISEQIPATSSNQLSNLKMIGSGLDKVMFVGHKIVWLEFLNRCLSGLVLYVIYYILPKKIRKL